MTTIAYRDGVLAADTACVCDGTYEGKVSKVRRCLDGTIVALAGDHANLAPFSKWVDEGGDAENKPTVSDSFSAIVVRPGGSLRHYDCNLVPIEIDAAYHAIGSGKFIAMGAMAAGKAADEAVRIACGMDVWSREPVEVFYAQPVNQVSSLVKMDKERRRART